MQSIAQYLGKSFWLGGAGDAQLTSVFKSLCCAGLTTLPKARTADSPALTACSRRRRCARWCCLTQKMVRFDYAFVPRVPLCRKLLHLHGRAGM